MLAITDDPREVCAKFRGLTAAGGRTATTWAVQPSDSHAEEAVIGVLTFGAPWAERRGAVARAAER